MKMAILSSKERLKKPKVNIHFGKMILVLLLVLNVFLEFEIKHSYAAIGDVRQLKDLPTGSIVYDSSWTWEHKTGDAYTGGGTTKAVEWIIVAKNHTDYPTNSVTLLSNELIARYYFDDRYNTDFSENYGYNRWGDSKIRSFLNTSFYNSFFNSFSSDFKNSILETTLNMKTHTGSTTYISKDKVFLPSVNELGGIYGTSDGSNWGYFSNDSSRIANLNGSAFALYYWTRCPESGDSHIVRHVGSDGWLSYGIIAYNSNGGVRPALNLKSDTLAKFVNGKWEIVYNSPPTLTVTSPIENSYFGKEPNNKITISGTVKDSDNGDTLKIYYRINGSSGQAGTQLGEDIIANTTNQNYSTQITLPALSDGNHNLYIWAEDNKGGKSTEIAVAFKVDTTNPTAPSITVNENWSKDNVAATIAGGTDTGGSGVARTEYSLSGATTLDWTTYSGSITIFNEGIIKIKARTVDNVGNISSEVSKEVKIDKTEPTININYSEDPTIDDLEIFTDITVGGSGIQVKKWDKGQQETSYFATNGTILEDKIIITDNGFITVYIKNGANVEVIKTIEINNAYKEIYENAKLAVDNAVIINLDNDIDLAEIEVNKIPDVFTIEKDFLQTILSTLRNIKTIVDIEDIRDTKSIITTKLSSYIYTNKLLEYLDDRIVVITDDRLVILEQKIEDLKEYNLDKYNDIVTYINDLKEYINEITDLGKKASQQDKLDKLVEIINIILDIEQLKDLVNIAENDKIQSNVDNAVNKANEIMGQVDTLPEEEKIYFTSILNQLLTRLDIVQKIIEINEDLKLLKDLVGIAQNLKTDENINSATNKADEIQVKIDLLPDSLDKELLQFRLNEFRQIIEVIENLKELEIDVIEVENAKLQTLLNQAILKGGIIQDKINNILDIEFKNALQQDLDQLLARLNLVQKIINIIDSIKDIQDMDDVKDIYDIIENELKDHPDRNDIVIDLVEEAIPIAETIEDIEYIETIIETLPDGPKKDELLDKLKDRLKEIIEDKLDELEKTIQEAEDKIIKDIIDDIVDKIDELEDLIDKLKELGEDTTEYEDRLDELKDRLDNFKEVIDVILKLEGVVLDLESTPATLTLSLFEEKSGYNKHYKYQVIDLETSIIIAEGVTLGEIIELDPIFDGHAYRVELEGYLNGKKVGEMVINKTKTDKIVPQLKYAYMLDGYLTVYATDNYKLHDKAYAFRIIKENEDIEVIKNTVVDTEFGTIAWVVNDNETITNINYDSNNKQNIPSPYPKAVTVRIRDHFGNVTTKTFNITKENEFLYGDVPQDIVDEINRKNNPPIIDYAPVNSSDGPNNNVGEKKDSSIVIDSKLPQEIKKEIEGILDNNNLEINPIDTESNSQKGGFTIDIKKELDNLNNLIKNQLGSSENTSYRITITEKDTNRLVYTKTSKYRENLIIPDLHDSTIYSIKISLVLDGKELAFREIEKMTYDKTPPIIEKILVKNNAIEIVARDNVKLHNKAYQYTINSSGIIAFNDNNINGLEILIIASNFDTNVWTEKSRLTGLDVGEKVTVIVRDHAENYTITEFEVKDGLVLDSVNNDKPLQLNKNSEMSIEELMNKILETYNEKNPYDKYDMSEFNKNNFTIVSSNPNVAYFENDKLITKNPGTVIITLTEKNTGKSYRYLIVVSKYVAFNRRIVVQTNSETDLLRVFEEQLYKHFEGTPIYLYIKEGEVYGDIDINIFRTYDSEGIVTIMATDGIKEVPFYAIVVEDEYPVSDVEVILSNIPYVVKKGNVVDIKEVSNFYNNLYSEANTNYLIAEVNSDVLDISQNKVYALNEGIGVVNIIDLANNRIEEIGFKVVDFRKSIQNNSHEMISGHWAEENIISLINHSIFDINSEFNPDDDITIEEFLTVISKTKTYKNTAFKRRNKLSLDSSSLSEENKYYVMDALNDFTMFEIEYIFNNNFNLNRNITREEIAVYLSLLFDLKSSSESEFKDVALSTRKNEIQSVKDNSIMVGYNDGTFKPTKYLTKAELATIINNINVHERNNTNN